MKIQYPSIVVQNHRYRGPMESKKDNDFMLGVTQSIERLKRMIQVNEENLSTVSHRINLKDNEDSEAYQRRHNLHIRIRALEGGELQ